MHKFLSNIFILSGAFLLLFACYLTYLRYSPNKLAFAQLPETVSTHKSVYPQRLTIESAHIDVTVYPTKLKENKWPTSTSGISYVETSSLPGKPGNGVFYGHNWSSLLGNLPKVTPGDEIDVQMSDGSTKKFIVEYTDAVKPDMTAIINQTSDTRITIYTCTGFLDSKRFVVVAKYLE